MGLLTAGYWAAAYWAADFWADDYWPDYGTPGNPYIEPGTKAVMDSRQGKASRDLREIKSVKHSDVFKGVKK